MKYKENLVSIIVPVYNASAFITTTIQSVLDQSYKEWELLLIEDCSTDDTLKHLEAFTDQRIQILRQTHNQGAAMARNRGIYESAGRYIAFLDADDIWKPEKLDKELQFLKKQDAAFVFTSYEFADEEGIGKGKIAHVPNQITYKEALKNTIIFTSTVLFDTTKITKELLSMPEVKSEDTATWWKILRNGYTAYGMDEVMVWYRRPAHSLSSNKIEAVRRVWNLYRKMEKLSFWYSAYNFMFYAVRTTARRL